MKVDLELQWDEIKSNVAVSSVRTCRGHVGHRRCTPTWPPHTLAYQITAQTKIGTCRGTCVYCAIYIGIIWCTLEPLSCTLKWTCTLSNRIPFWVLITWQQMLSQTCKCVSCWHDTQNPLKTKQIAQSIPKVKMNSMLSKAVKTIGPWIYLHMYET